MLQLRTETRRLEAMLSAVSSELAACRAIHAIELESARSVAVQQQQQYAQMGAAASTAAAEAVAAARA